jgi:hypothetical protein
MNIVRILAMAALACGLAGCGARDTEIDSIPGPGARSTTLPPIEPHRLELRRSSSAKAVRWSGGSVRGEKI